jgi:flagellar basal-body rod protein FlgC
MSGNFSSMDIAASGLMAERLRMEVISNNIANANTTMTETGDPYRRQSVVFAPAMSASQGGLSLGDNAGVRVLGIESNQSDFPVVYDPSHPHADKQGMVRMANVSIPNEMIDLITASRSYEANLKSITLLKEMVEQTLSLLRGGR